MARGLRARVERLPAGQRVGAIGHDQEPREERLERRPELGVRRPAERPVAARRHQGGRGVRDLGRRPDGYETRHHEVGAPQPVGGEAVGRTAGGLEPRGHDRVAEALQVAVQRGLEGRVERLDRLGQRTRQPVALPARQESARSADVPLEAGLHRLQRLEPTRGRVLAGASPRQDLARGLELLGRPAHGRGQRLDPRSPLAPLGVRVRHRGARPLAGLGGFHRLPAAGLELGPDPGDPLGRALRGAPLPGRRLARLAELLLQPLDLGRQMGALGAQLGLVLGVGPLAIEAQTADHGLEPLGGRMAIDLQVRAALLEVVRARGGAGVLDGQRFQPFRVVPERLAGDELRVLAARDLPPQVLDALADLFVPPARLEDLELEGLEPRLAVGQARRLLDLERLQPTPALRSRDPRARRAPSARSRSRGRRAWPPRLRTRASGAPCRPAASASSRSSPPRRRCLRRGADRRRSPPASARSPCAGSCSG